MHYLFALLFCGTGLVLFSGCTTPAVVSSGPAPAEQKDSVKAALVKAESEEILVLFAERSFDQLSAHVHPEKGVRFSAYCYIDTTSDLVFMPDEIYRQSRRLDSLNWGAYDGSGEPIQLTFYEYINKFVYTADFLHAEKTLVNQTIGFSNTIDNQQEIYPGNYYTTSWFSGFDPKLDGMDWCSLRLVYEFIGEKPYLIAVIHSQWTI